MQVYFDIFKIEKNYFFLFAMAIDITLGGICFAFYIKFIKVHTVYYVLKKLATN